MNNILEYLNENLRRLVGERFIGVNVGGCGVFAYLLARELQAVGIEFTIAWLESDTTDERFFEAISNAKKNNGGNYTLRDLNSEGIWCSHVMLMVGDKLVDCKGTFDNMNDAGWWNRVQVNGMELNDLRQLAMNEEGWNTSFDREQIPEMEKSIRNIVQDLDIK